MMSFRRTRGLHSRQAVPRIMELSYQGTFVRGNESSIGGTFVPWNFRSLELSFPGTFVPWNFRPQE